MITEDQRLFFPATERNRQPIWDVLAALVDEKRGPILEVASGSGQHLAFFRAHRPGCQWQGSDPEAAHRASIQAWNPDLPPALNLDVRGPWPDTIWGGILAINLLHISPRQATRGLFQGAAAHLEPGGWLYLYGAYLRREGANAISNLAFDQELRRQNPDWGVRCLEDVAEQARLSGLHLESLVDMPADNFSLIFRLK
ncbi:MAG: DUF938 domain-containing protein [Vulcanimicrobiota bacterium]